MNRRIFFGVLIGFVAGLLCGVGKKRQASAQVARTITAGKYDPPNSDKWDVRWPHTTADVLDTVLDEAIHRNGYTGPEQRKNQ